MAYINIEFGMGKRKEKPTAAAGNMEGMKFATDEAERARAEMRCNTAANYLTAVRSLSRFLGSADWKFSDITPRLLEGYQRWLCGRGLCLNTVSVYMRSLRTLYNRACGGEGGATTFRGVYTGREHTAKRSATADDLRRLRDWPLRDGSTLALARDLFLFSFFAMGMPFVDMAHLRKAQIRTGVMHYARQKTAQKVSVAIEPCMAEIISRYRSPTSDYVFPMLRDTTPETIDRVYHNRLRSYNYSLCRLSQIIGSSRPLSSYVARHSWASLAYSNSLDLQMIAKAMGHTKLSTTLIYIRSLFDPGLADANRNMMRNLGLD